MDISTVMAYASVVSSLTDVIQNLLMDNENLTDQILKADEENRELKEKLRVMELEDAFRKLPK